LPKLNATVPFDAGGASVVDGADVVAVAAAVVVGAAAVVVVAAAAVVVVSDESSLHAATISAKAASRMIARRVVEPLECLMVLLPQAMGSES
jgi:hypothetical protein